MPDKFPLLVPRAIEIGTRLKEQKSERRQLLAELERLERQAKEATRVARKILDNPEASVDDF